MRLAILIRSIITVIIEEITYNIIQPRLDFWDPHAEQLSNSKKHVVHVAAHENYDRDLPPKLMVFTMPNAQG